MTTAHRPTWKAAVGKAQEGGWSAGGAASTLRSVLDEPAHRKLKIRAGPQVVDRHAALKESLLKLKEAEEKTGASIRSKVLKRKIEPEIEKAGQLKLLKQTADVDDEDVRKKYNDGDDDDGKGGNSDVGDLSDSDDLDASDSSDEESSDDEDDEAALQAELAKIRAERDAAKAKEAAEAAAAEEAKMEEAALLGNPLLNAGTGMTGKLKRRWNDDVVFRNQAKGEPETNKKRFINDTVRNDFHRRFLNKFIH